MAFPQVESVTHTGISTAASSQNIDMPSSVEADNLLLMMLAYDGSGSAPTTPTGWTGLINSNSNSSGRMLVYKQAAGDEGGTSVSVTLGATAACAATVYEISGWNDLEYEDGIGNPTYTVSASPNPPSLSPSWGAADTLWIAGVMAVDDNGTFNSAPTNYTNLEQIAAGAAVNASAEVGSARRERNVATEDPGTFSMSEIEGWVAVTIAVEPGSKGGSGGGATTEVAATFGCSVGSTALGGADTLSDVSSGANCGTTSNSTAVAEASSSCDVSLNYTASSVLSIESLVSFSVGAGASSVAAAIASVQLDSSVGVQLSPSVVVVAEATIATASSLGVVVTGQAVASGSAEAEVVLAVSLDSVASAQALAESQVVIDASLASSVLAQAATEAGLTVGQILGMSCDGTTLSGDIVTPDGRKCTVSANLRACSIEGGARNIIVN